jgi:hypothetical protein
MQSNVKTSVSFYYAYIFLLIREHRILTLNVKGGDYMKLKVLALVLLVFFAAFATYSAIAQISFRQTNGNFGFSKVPFAYASNNTIIVPNGPIDTPGGPT